MKWKIIFLAFLLTFCVAGAGVASTINVDLGQSLINYANQGSVGGASYDAGTGILKFTGDTWKALKLNTPITSDSIISFDFRSNRQGELHGIGFDSDTSFVAADSKNFFQLYGTQPPSIPWWQASQEYKTYSGTDWVTYSIALSGIPAALNYLIFVNDNDANPRLVESEFRNLTVTAVPVPAAAWLLGAGLVGLAGIRRKMA